MTEESKASKAEKKATPSNINQGPIDIVKHRAIYLIISAILIFPGLYFMAQNMMANPNMSPVKLGIDFTGGTILEYGFHKTIVQDDLDAIRGVFEEKGYTGAVVQIQEPRIGINQDTIKLGEVADSETTTPEDTPETSTEEKPATETATTGDTGSEASVATTEATDESIKTIVSIRTKTLEGNDATIIRDELTTKFGKLDLLQKNLIGPTLANELMTNGLMALLFAYILIVGYLTYRFQFDYAIGAMLALIHDTIIVFGTFAALGIFFETEINSLFITAILTVIGFSVHDTIVVYDRIRENTRLLYSKKLPFTTIANISVNQTLARSINTSISTLFPLGTLYFFGGETTKDFVLAIIIGIVVGTYSSICVASLGLTWWRQTTGSGSGKAAATT